VAALDLAPRWPIRAVVCFGAPLIGWRRYAAAYDATEIKGRAGETLGDITTTYVFKSDLVRHIVLPRLGYKPVGQAMSIDEAGRTGEFDPWFQAALGVTLRAMDTISDSDPYLSVSSSPVYISPQNASPPHLDVRELMQVARPLIKPLFTLLPQLAAAALVLAGMFTAVLSAIFFRRDISYHSARIRYVSAMDARFSRWLPLAYNEQGENLLLATNAAGAVPYFTAALELAKADLESLPNKVRLTASFAEPGRQYTCRYRLNRAEAQQAIGDYPGAIADLTQVIESYGSGKIEIPVAADGGFSVFHQVAATQRRALAFELNKQWPQARTDYTALLAAKPDLNQTAYFAILGQAKRRFGAKSSIATVLGYRETEVRAETNRLLAVRQEAFDAGMAKTVEWAYYRRGLCAFSEKNYGAVVADATAAMRVNSSDAWVYNLRGGAQLALKNYEDAIKDFTRSIELEPKVAGFWFARAYARMIPGATLSPGEIGSQMNVLSTQLRVSDIPLIEADLRRTLDLEPSHSLAKSLLQGLVQAQKTANAASAG
jgi:tetratricopeptide (TPR) repeat protein